MGLQTRIESLKEKHANIEAELEVIVSRPHPDETTLASLKKQKLAIKDELETINTH